MAKKRSLILCILFNPKALVLLGLGVIILISFPIAKNVSQRRNINTEVMELKKEIKLIDDKNTQLQKLINYLSSDQYVEEQARLNFGLKKEGEKAVVVDTQGGLSAFAGTGGGINNANEENFQNAEDANLSDGKNGTKLTKSIYNIPGLDKAQPRKAVSSPGRWWKYFFDGS